MATQGGMKHAATTPSHLDTKRESTSRRRVGTGPAGRTSVLRRAPSDSDCSGETASLSADSADRVRPMPPTTRQAKTRSRRRGSEWEVLEGLKDGQRFERRPEVFNGYLHKKRKWPLKGWHKRFFVVDGGILVYARSPTDVARGRLHGSVDVGLSVISAKARRRRIDIDADEFIYHLRAKTPDVFRTWLNVLKAHRLYRQHLLTFGARESAPKIHAPLDDLPPTEASSPMSYSSAESLSPDNSKTLLLDILKAPKSAHFKTNVPCYNNAPIYCKSNQNHISNWFFESADNAELVPLHFEPLEDNNDVNVENDDGNTDLYNHSLCSMNCVAKRYQKYFEEVKPPHVESSGITENETQINHTDLGRNSPDTFCSSKFSNYPFNKDMVKPVFPAIYEPFRPVRPKAEKHIQPITGIVNRVTEPTTALFLFSKKKRTTPRSSSLDTPMKRSKKSTNVVKYKNVADEPPLKKPISKGMLLSKYHNKSTAQSNHSCEVIFDNDIRTADAIEDKSPNLPPPTEFDKNIEILIMSILGSKEGIANCVTIKDYVDEMVKEINNLKLAQSEIHPVKILLKYLLEYWLKNALPNSESVSSKVQSRTIQTNHCKTRDKNISSVLISCEHKHTQFHDSESLLDFLPKSQPFTCSYLKDRQIQELERVLKNTVYTFENANYNQSKIKDIETTKKLINNLDKRTKNPQEFKKIHSDSSMEFPEIQETFNNLIKDTSLSADVAKEFLGAYLDVLQNDSDKTSSLSTDDSKGDERDPPHCQVQAESIVKTMSKEVLTSGKDDNEKVCQVRQVMVDSGQDSGQVYLKGVLDKLTTIFTKADEKENERINAVKENFSKKLKGFDSDMIKEDLENNSVVVDLTKYDVENVSLLSDPVMKGAMSITVKLKQRLPNLNLAQTQKEISMKLSEDIPNIVTSTNSPEMINPLDSNVLYKNQLSNFNNSFIDYELNGHKDKIELRPFMSSSDATSKGYKTMYDNQSDRTLCSPKGSKENFMKRKSMEGHEDLQSYFVLSNLKKNLSSVFQPKKKVRVQDTKDTTIYPSRESSTCCMKRGECSGSQKSVPTAIDEHFILLLLENLTLLSLNMPSMHKEISNLFGRLKKKIEKDRRINRAGVGLLGQIYQSRLVENETQYDTETATKKSDSATKLIHKNINTDLEETNNAKIDKITSMVVVNTVLKDFNAQADERLLQKYNVEVAGTAFKKSNFEALGCKTGPSTKAESKRNWMEAIHKDNALSNIIKCLIENSSSCQNFRFVSKEDPRLRTRDKHVINKGSCQSFKIIYCEKDLVEKTDRPKWQNVRQDQGSSHMCENKMKKLLKDLKLKRDYNVYQLFMSNKFRMSGSLSGSDIVVRELSDDLKTIYRCTSEPSYCSGLLSPVSPPLRGPQAGFVAGTPGGRLASWIIESGGPLENATRELGQASLSVQQLQRLLDALELQQHQHDTDQMSLEGASPNVKKDRRKFGLRKKKSNSKCASVELAPPHHVDASASHMALSALTAPPSPGGGASSMPSSAASLPIACAAARPQSLPGTEVLAAGVGPASLSSLTPDQQLREDFTVLAKDLLATLKGVVSTLVCERGRLRAAMESGEGGAGGAAGAGGGAVAALRTNLSSALQQNSELRSRLSRIHDASDLAEISSVNNSDPVCRQFPQSLSYSSSCVSASEFFDAEEHDPPADLLPADETGVIELDGDSSSDAGSLSSEDGSDASAGSDNSEGALAPAEPSSLTLNQNGVEESGWTRRTRLPCPRPTPGGPSLWNLLYKNIGKDLSQVSMPVTINEPLNMLQRLCEELEYSGLLDTAAACSGAAERLCLVAAFAVSAYAATAHRAASKPFNPLLQESYECVRPDRGFHFLAEQVSHHPPISACHAESPNWCFWQEARIKTKFWGKSMEFQPAGRVHVRLLPNGDHYSWNKVTTCVHNLFGGQRWVDQYGDMHIVCHDNDMSCKLQFIKASSWSSSRHEVRGWVSGGGGPRLRLHGRWSEALYAGDPPAARCLWRPGAMPPDNDLYYGFTRFAMELNEMEPGLRELLPHTDTRLRPDQRALEEGAVDAAEQYKHDLEQAQRDRRRDQPDPPPAWFRKSAEGGEEMWVFTGEYWKARSAGFPAADGRAPRLW